ncbi:hypothetical protein KIW84_013155 [Lathyrus oleraceus]|uniref:Uncharacterized protein n=1 Tax=Pisum sativum TaxID=3888 RepID=A0A9D5GXM6_PEA|nr:hypothetical protein KIW84_013155 [Pisum sativum]
MVTSEGGTTSLKLEVEWTDDEDKEALGNSKALNVIFNGTTKVRVSRLQLLTIKFENLRKNKDESICEFHIRLRDFSNTSFEFCEKMYVEKLARKILILLHKKLDMKVAAIEEARDLGSIKVDELIGSIQTFEISINERSENKNKGIAFVSNTKESQSDKEENLPDDIAFLGIIFNQSLKYLARNLRSNVQDMRFSKVLHILLHVYTKRTDCSKMDDHNIRRTNDH